MQANRIRLRLLPRGSASWQHAPTQQQMQPIRDSALQGRVVSVERVARTHPTSSATQVRRNLKIEKRTFYVSPTKHRHFQRVVKQVHKTVFVWFMMGQQVDNSEGALMRLSTNIFLKTLVEELYRGG